MRSLCLIACFAIALSRAHGAGFAGKEIPFEYREGLLWIKATASNCSDTLSLLLDTGAAVSVLNATTAERLKLKLGERLNVRGVETTFIGRRVKGVSLMTDGFLLSAPSIAVDLQNLSASCANRVDGLIGADFFRGRIVQIDFVAQKIRTLRSQSGSITEDSLSLQLRPCGMRVPINVNRRKAQWVRLDTGCASALQWVTSDVPPEDCIRKTAIGLTQVSVPEIRTTVEMGSHEFKNVPTGLHEKPIFAGEAGLLGNGLLSRFSTITIDAKSGRLFLEPRPLLQ